MTLNQVVRAASRFSRPLQQHNISMLSRSFCVTGAAPSPVENKRCVVLSPPSPQQNNSVEGKVWRTALENIQRKQKDEINNLQWLKDSLRVAQMTPLTKSTATTNNPEQSEHTFQIMNRNARKAKRANHGKRPCSRDRRRWKTRSWANTSRRG